MFASGCKLPVGGFWAKSQLERQLTTQTVWKLIVICESGKWKPILSNNSFQVDFIITILMQSLSYLGLAHHRPDFFRLFTQPGPTADTVGFPVVVTNAALADGECFWMYSSYQPMLDYRVVVIAWCMYNTTRPVCCFNMYDMCKSNCRRSFVELSSQVLLKQFDKLQVLIGDLIKSCN